MLMFASVSSMLRIRLPYPIHMSNFVHLRHIRFSPSSHLHSFGQCCLELCKYQARCYVDMCMHSTCKPLVHIIGIMYRIVYCFVALVLLVDDIYSEIVYQQCVYFHSFARQFPRFFSYPWCVWSACVRVRHKSRRIPHAGRSDACRRYDDNGLQCVKLHL
jgi:hypothetical protein